jgi:ribosome-associated protein
LTPSDNSELTLNTILDALQDKKAVDIEQIDVRGKTLMADYFVICTATSRPQMNAILDSVREKFRDAGLPRPKVEGEGDSRWFVLDAGVVIAHVMAPDERAFYNLEHFWRNAPLLPS